MKYTSEYCVKLRVFDTLEDHRIEQQLMANGSRVFGTGAAGTLLAWLWRQKQAVRAKAAASTFLLQVPYSMAVCSYRLYRNRGAVAHYYSWKRVVIWVGLWCSASSVTTATCNCQNIPVKWKKIWGSQHSGYQCLESCPCRGPKKLNFLKWFN